MSLSNTNFQSLLKLMSIESVMSSIHFILCRPLLLLASMFPSIRGPDYWSFSFSISASNIYSELISFSLLAVQETLKSIHLHHNLKASILPCSAVFTVQISHPYMTAGKTIVIARRRFSGKAMSLLLNMLSR